MDNSSYNARLVKISTIVINIIVWFVVLINFVLHENDISYAGITAGLAINVLYFIFFRSRNFSLWTHLSLNFFILINWYLFFTRDLVHAAHLWAFLFPVFAYELLHYKKAARYVIIFYGGLLLIYLFVWTNTGQFKYPPFFSAVLFFSLTGIFLVLHLYNTRRYTAERALRESERSFKRLSENSPAVVFQFRWRSAESFHFTYISRLITSIMDLDTENVINDPMIILSKIHPDDYQRFLNEHRQAHESKSKFHTEIRYMKNDETRWAEIHSVAEFLSDGSSLWDGFFQDITERKRAAEKIEYQKSFFGLVADISTDFVSINRSSVDQKINSMLQQTGKFLDVDRTFIFRLSSDMKWLSNTHEWCAPGIIHMIDTLQNLDVENTPWINDLVKNREMMFFPDVDALPDEFTEEREELKRQHIKSVLCIPVIKNNQIKGYFGFDAVARKCDLNHEQLRLMQVLANILGDAFERIEAHDALSESERLSRETAARYMAFIEATNTGAWEYNKTKGYLWCSPQYFQMLGRNPDDFKSEDKRTIDLIWKQWLHPDDHAQAIRRFDEYFLKPASVYQQIFRLKHNDGSYRWILSRGKILTDESGKPTDTMMGTHIDITLQKNAEETIKEKNKELESFLYVASHDLRSPLVNIQGFSNRVENQIEDLKIFFKKSSLPQPDEHPVIELINGEIPQTLSHISNNVRKMDSLINGLLSISRTGRVKMMIKKVNLEELINKIIRSYGYQLDNIGAEVKIGEMPSCFGDPELLNQLFSNLIDNAIKYRRQGIPLSLDISGETAQNSVIVKIKDNGIGINQRNKYKIWEVFFRTDPSSEKDGEGIGLNISLTIAQKHKGRIWVESELGKGSTFYVQLSSSSLSV